MTSRTYRRRERHAARAAELTHPTTRLLLAQRAPAESYPPVLSQARILAGSHLVTVLDALFERDKSHYLTEPSVARIRVPINSRLGPWGRIGRIVSSVRYAASFQNALRRSWHAAIAYDPEAIALLLALTSRHSRGIRIAHLHEALELDRQRCSTALHRATKYLLRHLRNADLVVVPDHFRARLLADQASLRELPVVVMNCPPLLHALPKSKLVTWLCARGAPIDRIVHYQGSIGGDHCLEHVVASMPLWPSDAVFVLVGAGRASYVERLRKIAAERGTANRLFFVGRVPYDQVNDYSMGAAVGVSLLAPSCDNWKYGAGASNKRFEYAALGIPQVTNVGPDIGRLFQQTGIARAVEPSDASAIANAIASYLLARDDARAAGERARALHLSTYNYEHQFAPVEGMLAEAALTRQRVLG